MTKISNVNNSKEVDSYDLQNVKNIETSIVQRSKCQEFQNFKGTKVDHGPEMQSRSKAESAKVQQRWSVTISASFITVLVSCVIAKSQ